MSPIETTYAWHGGGGSPLYSFASTRKLWSEDHRIDVIAEIRECIIISEREGQIDPDENDMSNLEELLKVVRSLRVGEKLPDPYGA